MNVTRGMKRLKIAIIVITFPLFTLGAITTYIGFVQVDNFNSGLTKPGGPQVIESYTDGETKVLSPEDSRKSILYALKFAQETRAFGLFLLCLSAGLWGLYWIIAGFSSERQPNQSLEADD